MKAVLWRNGYTVLDNCSPLPRFFCCAGCGKVAQITPEPLIDLWVRFLYRLLKIQSKDQENTNSLPPPLSPPPSTPWDSTIASLCMRTYMQTYTHRSPSTTRFFGFVCHRGPLIISTAFLFHFPADRSINHHGGRSLPGDAEASDRPSPQRWPQVLVCLREQRELRRSTVPLTDSGSVTVSYILVMQRTREEITIPGANIDPNPLSSDANLKPTPLPPSPALPTTPPTTQRTAQSTAAQGTRSRKATTEASDGDKADKGSAGRSLNSRHLAHHHRRPQSC